MTDLDDLRTKWADHDRKLDASLRLNRRLLTAMTLDRARRPLRRFAIYLVLEVLLGVVTVVLLGSFLYDHLGAARFVIPAAALDLGAIGLLRSTIVQLMQTLQIDHGDPVAAVQRRIEVLRMQRSRYVRWILIASPLIWTPLAIVLLQGVLGIDAYVVPGVPWLIANLAFGVVVLAAALWISSRYGERLGRHPLLHRLARSLAGYHLHAAAGHLEALSAFEDELAGAPDL
jgi:hypothetical protein